MKKFVLRDCAAVAVVHGVTATRQALAAELGCLVTDIVAWTHPDRDTQCLSLPDADEGEPWAEEISSHA
jgi:hypothetical protein